MGEKKIVYYTTCDISTSGNKTNQNIGKILQVNYFQSWEKIFPATFVILLASNMDFHVLFLDKEILAVKIKTIC